MPVGRRPAVLVLLDGLGDRSLPELGGRTPAEHARTPWLDALARRGASGLHVPFGPGRAPSSEVAHWSLFGYDGVPFCGRAVLEALGHGQSVPFGVVHLHAALRSSEVRDGRVWLTGRAASGDADDAAELLAAVAVHETDGLRFALQPLGRGEATLTVHGAAVAEVTDSDPFFEHLHPWLRPRAWADASQGTAARRTADALAAHLRWARATLRDHPTNRRRGREGRASLDTLTTKWSGVRRPLPPFEERVGVPGALVTSSALYRGYARLLGMHAVHIETGDDPGADLAERLAAAAQLLGEGAAFVHVHTKVLDEAGHTKDPNAKRLALEALDPAFEALDRGPLASALVAVTGDHATPSRDDVLHTGDPSPLVLSGPGVTPDPVVTFGEEPAAVGRLGTLRAADILPLMLSWANRPRFLGARTTPEDTLALPECVEAMPCD